MIYEVHLRNPYRVLRIESDSMYSAGESLTFANNDTAVHLFRLEDVISVTNPFAVNYAEIVTGMREGTRLPLTVDSNMVQDSLQRESHAPSILAQGRGGTSGAWGPRDYEESPGLYPPEPIVSIRPTPNEWYVPEIDRVTSTLSRATGQTTAVEAERMAAIRSVSETRPEGQVIRMYDDTSTAMRNF